MNPRRSLFTLLLATATGCFMPPRPVPRFDAQANFAAWVDRHDIRLSRLPDGGDGVVEPPGFSLSRTRRYTLVRDGKTTAELDLTAPGTVAVQQARADTPEGGGVDPTWEQNAIRLTLRTPGAATFHTEEFHRSDNGGAPERIARNAQYNVDLRGEFRAVVRDEQGADVGWIRVRLGPYFAAPRIYDGVLPAQLSPGVAAAIPVALGSELDWIESQTVDLYKEGTGGGLHQSFPMTK